MTAPISATPDALDQQWVFTFRYVETSLRRAIERLIGDACDADVRAAEAALDDAERALAVLTLDPWEPALGPVRDAREVLSSHLLAATACAGADVAPAITAKVLQRGAESARRLLSADARS